jgi:biopolymer transport protein ExbD
MFGAARYSAMSDMPVESTVFRPQLTSLIDVMTFLLVFLIKSFSVEGNIITPSSNLELPLSTSLQRPSVIPSIEISTQAVMSEGIVIVPLGDIARSEGRLIAPLHQWMMLQRSKAADTAAAHQVMIQSDREIPFSIVKKVLYTCSKAGFSDYSILVIQKE